MLQEQRAGDLLHSQGRKPTCLKLLAEVFVESDADGSGTLDKDEFNQIFEEWGPHMKLLFYILFYYILFYILFYIILFYIFSFIILFLYGFMLDLP